IGLGLRPVDRVDTRGDVGEWNRADGFGCGCHAHNLGQRSRLRHPISGNLFVIASEAKQSISTRRKHGLLRRFAPRKKQLVEWVSGRLRAWLQLDGEAEFFEARDQSACFELDWPA